MFSNGFSLHGQCNGLMVPIVAFDQIYSFDVDTLIGSIPRPNQIAEDRFNAMAEEVFDLVGLRHSDRELRRWRNSKPTCIGTFSIDY
jgi:hypothetical protein